MPAPMNTAPTSAPSRSTKVAACMIGLGLARYVLELPAVAGASREDV